MNKIKSSICDAKNIFLSSLRFFRTYPKSIFPLLFCWIIYASTILYMEYNFDWNKYSMQLNILIVFGIYVLFALSYGIACLIVLEIAQQVEQGEKPSFFNAVKDAMIKDLWKAIPIILLWAILWFILSLLAALFSKIRSTEKSDLTAHSAVGTLLGDGKKFSLTSTFFHALSKGIRMVTFLIFPAIAWEDLGTAKAFRKGLHVLGEIKKDFLIAYGVTGLFFLMVMFVPALIFYIDSKLSLELPGFFWALVLIYMAFAMSLSFLVEQLYVAELYLWYMKWERESAQNTSQKLSDTARPSFFDDINSMEK